MLFWRRGCTARFTDRNSMLQHAAHCAFNYQNTSQYTPIEEIIAVFGKAKRKLFLVKWEEHPGEDSWLPEHSLLEDGYKDSIDEF